jgi:hypothetical protein
MRSDSALIDDCIVSRVYDIPVLKILHDRLIITEVVDVRRLQIVVLYF